MSRCPPGAQRCLGGQGSQSSRAKRATRSPLVVFRSALGLYIAVVLPSGQVTVSLSRSIAKRSLGITLSLGELPCTAASTSRRCAAAAGRALPLFVCASREVAAGPRLVQLLAKRQPTVGTRQVTGVV
jgi:hypothetical protein